MNLPQATKAVQRVLPAAVVTVVREYSFSFGRMVWRARAEAPTGDAFGEGMTRGQALARMVESARWYVSERFRGDVTFRIAADDMEEVEAIRQAVGA